MSARMLVCTSFFSIKTMIGGPDAPGLRAGCHINLARRRRTERQHEQWKRTQRQSG